MKNIKSITGITYNIGENDTILNEYKSSYQEFDLNNNIIKEIEYSKNGEFESAIEYKYNDKFNITEEINYIDEEEVGEHIIFKFDEEDNLIGTETTFPDGSKSIEVATHNENVWIILTHDEKGNFEGEEIRKFDENDNIIEETIYDEDKKNIQKIIYEYDDKFNNVSSTEYGEKGIFVVRKNFVFNEEGSVVKESSYNERGILINITESKYNDEDELILQQIDNAYLIEITYDDNNRKIKQQTTNLSINLVELLIIYNYDDEGFLIEEITFDMVQQYNVYHATGIINSKSISTKYQYEFFKTE